MLSFALLFATYEAYYESWPEVLVKHGYRMGAEKLQASVVLDWRGNWSLGLLKLTHGKDLIAFSNRNNCQSCLICLVA